MPASVTVTLPDVGIGMFGAAPEQAAKSKRARIARVFIRGA
jgi:hypothetical protein